MSEGTCEWPEGCPEAAVEPTRFCHVHNEESSRVFLETVKRMDGLPEPYDPRCPAFFGQNGIHRCDLFRGHRGDHFANVGTDDQTRWTDAQPCQAIQGDPIDGWYGPGSPRCSLNRGHAGPHTTKDGYRWV